MSKTGQTETRRVQLVGWAAVEEAVRRCKCSEADEQGWVIRDVEWFNHHEHCNLTGIANMMRVIPWGEQRRRIRELTQEAHLHICKHCGAPLN